MMQQFGDKEALTSALSSIKHMTMLYNDVASQTDDNQLAHDLCNMIEEEHQARAQVYRIMNQQGWYNPQIVDEQQLRKAQQKFSQMGQTAGAQYQFGWDSPTTANTWNNQQAGGNWMGGPQQSGGWEGQQGGSGYRQ